MYKVLYNGIGANESGEHSVEHFLEIMARHFTYKNWTDDIIYKVSGKNNHYQLQFKNYNLPDDFKLFTLDDWLDYSGAKLVEV